MLTRDEEIQANREYKEVSSLNSGWYHPVYLRPGPDAWQAKNQEGTWQGKVKDQKGKGGKDKGRKMGKGKNNKENGKDKERSVSIQDEW